ncbi:MAG: hypothetical protein ACFB6R_02585 [Alphaproteobacteria bacterium]
MTYDTVQSATTQTAHGEKKAGLKESGAAQDFFDQCGALSLDKDRSQHRRYAWLFEDLLA